MPGISGALEADPAQILPRVPVAGGTLAFLARTVPRSLTMAKLRLRAIEPVRPATDAENRRAWPPTIPLRVAAICSRSRRDTVALPLSVATENGREPREFQGGARAISGDGRLCLSRRAGRCVDIPGKSRSSRARDSLSPPWQLEFVRQPRDARRHPPFATIESQRCCRRGSPRGVGSNGSARRRDTRMPACRDRGPRMRSRPQPPPDHNRIRVARWSK